MPAHTTTAIRVRSAPDRRYRRHRGDHGEGIDPRRATTAQRCRSTPAPSDAIRARVRSEGSRNVTAPASTAGRPPGPGTHPRPGRRPNRLGGGGGAHPSRARPGVGIATHPGRWRTSRLCCQLRQPAHHRLRNPPQKGSPRSRRTGWRKCAEPCKPLSAADPSERKWCHRARCIATDGADTPADAWVVRGRSANRTRWPLHAGHYGRWAT